MTRLRSLIKEILSSPKKKDCGCGCNTCGDKAPILTEGKFKSLISEGLQHHIDKKISLFESVYRIGSEKHLELIREARALWIRGIIKVSDDDKGLLETHLGHFGLYEGVEVPLDLPMINEKEGVPHYTKDGKEWKGKVHKMPNGKLMTQNPHNEDSEELFHKEDLNEDQDKWVVYDTKTKKILPNAGKIYKDKKAAQAFADKQENAKVASDTFYFDKIQEESVNEEMGEWPKELTSRYSDEYRFELEKVTPTYQDKPGRAKYRVIDIESGELKGTPVFGTPESLMAFADDLIKPQGGTQSSNFGESLEERIVNILEAKKKKKKEKKDPPLNKPKRGGSKAYYVYVRDPKTKKIKKVSFGSGGLRAKIKNKEARNAFAARHNCKNKKDRTKAGYWSCNLPRYAEQLGLGSKMNTFW